MASDSCCCHDEGDRGQPWFVEFYTAPDSTNPICWRHAATENEVKAFANSVRGNNGHGRADLF